MTLKISEMVQVIVVLHNLLWCDRGLVVDNCGKPSPRYLVWAILIKVSTEKNTLIFHPYILHEVMTCFYVEWWRCEDMTWSISAQIMLLYTLHVFSGINNICKPCNDVVYFIYWKKKGNDIPRGLVILLIIFASLCGALHRPCKAWCTDSPRGLQSVPDRKPEARENQEACGAKRQGGSKRTQAIPNY
jgi:hypothetical protein